MKKIVWIFGESATGKKTFILHALQNNNPVLKQILGVNDNKISVCQCTIDENNASFDDTENEKIRRVDILQSIEKFTQLDDCSVLLLKGQCNDMDERYGNTLKECALKYPNIQKEIILLEVSDLDLLYNRIINKDWFKEDEQRYSKMFPRQWIDKAVIKHRNQVMNYEKYGYKITTIDSTNEYRIIGTGRSKNE